MLHCVPKGKSDEKSLYPARPALDCCGRPGWPSELLQHKARMRMLYDQEREEITSSIDLNGCARVNYH